jgi:hypothetical protein
MKRIALALCLVLPFVNYGFEREAPKKNPPILLHNGFQIGLGGSYNSVSLDQYGSGIGISTVTSSGTIVAEGEAGGPAVPYRETKSIFSPVGEIGYFRHFGSKPWFWGGKFFYQYLGLDFSDGPIDSLQSGAFTTVSGSDSFFGNAVIQSSQTLVNHELVLMPFIGRSFNNTHIYLGGGAVVFQVDFHQYNFIGFADVNGTHTDITGTPASFSNSEWMWGGGGQIGVTQYLNPAWFLDFSYTYLVTGHTSFQDSGAFSSSSMAGMTTYITSGTAYINATQRIIVQSLTAALNFLF